MASPCCAVDLLVVPAGDERMHNCILSCMPWRSPKASDFVSSKFGTDRVEEPFQGEASNAKQQLLSILCFVTISLCSAAVEQQRGRPTVAPVLLSSVRGIQFRSGRHTTRRQLCGSPAEPPVLRPPNRRQSDADSSWASLPLRHGFAARGDGEAGTRAPGSAQHALRRHSGKLPLSLSGMWTAELRRLNPQHDGPPRNGRPQLPRMA